MLSSSFFDSTQVLAQKGQNTEFKASAPAVVTLGRAFNYSITGNENIRGSVQIPETDGIRVVAGPSTYISTQSSFINGKMENVTTSTFSYNIIATKEGSITIPPAVIIAGNKTFTTNAVEITVVSAGSAPQGQDATNQGRAEDSKATEDYYVRLSPSKRSVYIGEELLMESKIFTNQRLQFSEIKYPEFEGFWKQDLEADQQASREIINNSEYLTQVFKRELLIPQKTGEFSIKPLEVTALVQQRVRTQRRNPLGDIFSDPFFSDPFFESFENVPVVLTSPAVTISVNQLPAGSPEGFTGAVGQFTIDISADRDKVKANDAISLRITLRGKGNLSLISAPHIALPHDVEAFEPKILRNINHTLNGTTGTVIFEYVIIPRYSGNFRIPPVNFSFFNPSGKTYQQLKTKEINFQVETGTDSIHHSISGGQITIPGIQREKVENIGSDILFIKTNNPSFTRSDRDISTSIFFKLFFPAGILAYILLVIVYRNRIRRNSDVAYTRTRKAMKKAGKRLNSAKKLVGVHDKKLYNEMHSTVWEYLSDKLNIPRAELSRNSIEEGLRESEVPENMLAELWEVIDECEMTGYATGSATAPKVVFQKTRDILVKLDQTLK